LSKKVNKCPKCGSEVKEPLKIWQLVSPIPDAKGRITITVMGSFQCNNCGHRWRGVVSKIKAGGTSIDVESASGKRIVGEEREEKREGYVIEIDLEDLEEEL